MLPNKIFQEDLKFLFLFEKQPLLEALSCTLGSLGGSGKGVMSWTAAASRAASKTKEEKEKKKEEEAEEEESDDTWDLDRFLANGIWWPALYLADGNSFCIDVEKTTNWLQISMQVTWVLTPHLCHCCPAEL